MLFIPHFKGRSVVAVTKQLFKQQYQTRRHVHNKNYADTMYTTVNDKHRTAISLLGFLAWVFMGKKCTETKRTYT